MSKHTVKDSFNMSARLEIIQDRMEYETALRPSKSDILCSAVLEYMQKRDLKYQPEQPDEGPVDLMHAFD